MDDTKYGLLKHNSTGSIVNLLCEVLIFISNVYPTPPASLSTSLLSPLLPSTLPLN